MFSAHFTIFHFFLMFLVLKSEVPRRENEITPNQQKKTQKMMYSFENSKFQLPILLQKYRKVVPQTFIITNKVILKFEARKFCIFDFTTS